MTIDGSGIKRQPISSHDERWLWTHELTPALQTHDMYLRDFLDWYARQTGIEISYASADIEHAIVNTETHRIKGNLDTDIVVALDEAMLVDGFTATPQDGRVVISR